MTTRKANFRILNPILATTREVAELLNRTIGGGLNSWDYVTLSASTTETTKTDPRFSKESVVFLPQSMGLLRTISRLSNQHQPTGR